MKNKLCIIGLGWLGYDLAAHFASQSSWSVTGTVRQTEKAQRLANRLSIDVSAYDCYQSFPKDKLEDYFKDATLIINIAAGHKQLDPKSYTSAICGLMDLAIQTGCRHILFISTSSVFGACKGTVSRNTSPSAHTASGQAHIAIEEHLLNQYHNQGSVLRLAGLVGPNPDKGFRHPVYSLAKLSRVPSGNHGVNLIHKMDVITAIDTIITQQLSGVAYNLCSIEHPTKFEYYTWCARQLGLSLPQFDLNPDPDRQIDASDSLQTLGLRLKYPSPYDMLEHEHANHRT